MTSVFAANVKLDANNQKKITMQEYDSLFKSANALESNIVSEVIQLSDAAFVFKFYGQDTHFKPVRNELYFEVYSPFNGENTYFEARVDGLIYKGELHRGRIAELVNGEPRYWYFGWLEGKLSE